MVDLGAASHGRTGRGAQRDALAARVPPPTETTSGPRRTETSRNVSRRLESADRDGPLPVHHQDQSQLRAPRH